MKHIYCYLTVFACLLSSCGDFLKEQSKELKYAVSCEDLNELLVGGAYMKHVAGAKDSYSLVIKGDDAEYFPWIHVLDDDSEELIKGGIETGMDSPRSKVGAFHYWEKDPFNVKGTPYTDNVWKRLYIHIGVINAVLDKADQFANDPAELRNKVKGEAYFLRAAYYFLLVNFYAKPYSEISASTDLGVPLKISADVQDIQWRRSTIEAVYEQIVSDLGSAIKCLSGIPPKSMHRGSETAAYLLLSRVYCYMGKWELVPELCNHVMEKGYSLIDLNTHPVITSPNTNSFNSQLSPEIIFTQGSCTLHNIFASWQSSYKLFFKPSDELLDLYALNDMRLKAFYMANAVTYASHVPSKFKTSGNTGGMVSDVYLLRLSEAYLNKAEALAMSGEEEEAKETLQILRKKRFKPADLTSLDQYSGGSLIQFIRDERRRELCFEGHRWFDLRRYAVSPKYPMLKEIRHPHYDPPEAIGNYPGTLTGYYILPKYPNGNWVLPIPSYEIEMNGGKMIDNERQESVLYN